MNTQTNTSKDKCDHDDGTTTSSGLRTWLVGGRCNMCGEYVGMTSTVKIEPGYQLPDGTEILAMTAKLPNGDFMSYTQAGIFSLMNRLITEARIDQTKFLQKAEKEFGKVDWQAALYELSEHPRIAAKLEDKSGG